MRAWGACGPSSILGSPTIMQKESALVFFIKSVFFLAIIYLSYNLIFKKESYFLLDHLNLLIHESGHLVFMPFGDFMQTLGGSLTQVIIPFLFLIYFLKRKDLFSSAFSTFWISSNLIDVSIYIDDAKFQILLLHLLLMIEMNRPRKMIRLGLFLELLQ